MKHNKFSLFTIASLLAGGLVGFSPALLAADAPADNKDKPAAQQPAPAQADQAKAQKAY